MSSSASFPCAADSLYPLHPSAMAIRDGHLRSGDGKLLTIPQTSEDISGASTRTNPRKKHHEKVSFIASPAAWYRIENGLKSEKKKTIEMALAPKWEKKLPQNG